MVGKIFLARNASELAAFLEKASAGDQIKLAGGDYGNFSIQNRDFGSGIVVSAADPKNPPKFNTMSLWNVDGITLDGLDFNFTPTAKTLSWESALRVDGSTGISIRNSTFTGGDAVAGISPDSPAGTQNGNGILGYPIGRAITVQNSSEISIEHNDISHFEAGIRFSKVNGIELNHNEISDFRKVPVGGGNVQNVHIEGNYFHDANPWKFGGLGDHGDFIHFWTVPGQAGPSQNITIAENYFAQGDGKAILGVYLDDNGNNIGFKNVSITDNLIHLGNSQGMRLENVTGLEILNNTILPHGDDGVDSPKINLIKTQDVMISGNIFSGIVGPALLTLAKNGITLGDNLVVQRDDPLGPNYIGDLFVDALSENPDLNDLRTLPDSAADGYGPRATLLSWSQGFDAALIETRGEGQDLLTHKFNVLEVLDLKEATALNGARIQWDFGDGTRAEGLQTNHSFASAGTYTTTVKITLANGAVHTFSKTIEVLSPTTLITDFNSGIGDLADIPHDHTINGTVQLVASDRGKSIQLAGGKSSVEYEVTDAMQGNSEFSISFGFRKNTGSEGNDARVLDYAGTAIVSVHADGITLRARTSLGEPIVIRANGIGIRDDDWHQVTYSFSQETGLAVLFVDGIEVGRVTDLKGEQYTIPGQNLHLGNPNGAAFSGQIDDLVFRRFDLTAAEAKDAYADFQAGNVWEGDSSVVATIPQVAGAASSISSASWVGEVASQSGSTLSLGDTSFTPPNLKGNSELSADTSIDSKGLQLLETGTTASIDHTHIADLFDADDFSIQLEIKADSTTSTGEVFGVHGSMVASVNRNGEFSVQLFSENGTNKTLTSTGLKINDLAEHAIDIRLENGTASLWIDGDMVSETAFSGRLRDFGSRDLAFGSPWGHQNFYGDLTAFELSLDAYPPSESGQDHDLMMAQTSTISLLPMV